MAIGSAMARLTRAFFLRSPVLVAPALLGCHIAHTLPDGRRLVGRIVETEAYLGDGSDPASHAHRGPTSRNRSMFGPPARFYVYRAMGLHTCTNVVCGAAGVGAAVLIRAVEAIEGEAEMERRRGRGGRELASGPGKLSEALGITLAHDGAPALAGHLRLVAGGSGESPVVSGPRIGITKASALPYRFFYPDHPAVTRSKLNREARPWRDRPARGGGGPYPARP